MTDIIPNPFKLVRISELVAKEPDYLVDGLLEREVMAVAFGDPGAGKSFLTIDIAARISTGTPFHGRETQRGAVIYIAGEGHGGIARRRAAWETETEVSLTGAPFFVSTVAGNFLDEAVTQQVVQAIEVEAETAGPPALIVIDTLARNFGGGDENSTKDMTQFTNAIDAVRARWRGCSALIVHHTGHGPKDRGRGSMALKGATDAEYRVEKEGMVMTLDCTKMKDGPPPAPIAFDLVEITIGQDRRERAITSLALRLTDAKPKRRSALTGQAAIAMQAFGDALAHHGEIRTGDMFPPNRQCITLERWREYCDRHELSGGETATARRTAFHKAKTKLQESGIVRIVDGWVWRADE